MTHKVLKIPLSDVGRGFIDSEICVNTTGLHKGLDKLGTDLKIDPAIVIIDLINHRLGVRERLYCVNLASSEFKAMTSKCWPKRTLRLCTPGMALKAPTGGDLSGRA
jgi:hypothetical protein